LDATTRIPELIEKLKESGMKSCAITDHGNMYGVYKFQKAMKDEGLKPIIGCEIYIAPREMDKKEHGIDNNYNHLVVIAKNLTGYKNLMKIVSVAHMEGFYYKPRIDFETLSKYTEGIIVTSACLAGPLAAPLLKNDYKKALEEAKRYSKIFKVNFYVEIQRNGMEEQDLVNEGLIKIAKELNLPLVATCDAHYVNKEDAEIQEILWCIDDGRTLDDPERRRMPTNEFYVKTSEEMEELFKDIPEAIKNTQKIADQVEEYDITFGRVEPVFLDLPKGETSKSFLRKLTLEGAKEKYGKVDKDLQKRIDYELEIIDDKGYNDYFLVVRDFVMFCRENGIVVGMRGSGCGSVVAYATDITNIEPIGWELYFERFLNPERESPPDFDIDIADRRRDELIQYAVDKYGEEHVKQIGTFSKLQTRQALRDVSRVIGVDLSVADQLSKMVEIVFGKAKDIEYMMEHNPEFQDLINSSELTRRLAGIVKKVAGLCRGVSTHACGVIISPEPVVEYAPIQRDAHGGGLGMTQYEMFDTEAVGLMKFDFLGLRNLNIIGTTIKKIEVDTGEEIDLRKIDPADKATFRTIQSGHTIGLFQMESDGMKRTIRGLKPESQEEICYILAAYRPGPMQYIPEYIAVKNGEKNVEYLFPELEHILSITNGVITYQEQVIRIATDIAGYTMGAADILRKAMGKKKMDIMEKEHPVFVSGAVKKGFDKKKVEKLWDDLIQFANYGFNKAHSASYATVSYWTAYLKTHYPLEFMAGLLEGDLDNFDRVIADLEECERMGIDVLPPTINKSGFYFGIENGKDIRFSLAAIKNVGEDVVKKIIKERDENGEFKHLDDFVHRVFKVGVPKRAIEYLVMAGALDEFGSRGALLELVPQLYEREKKSNASLAMGQIDIFSVNGEEQKVRKTVLPDIKAPRSDILQWEKDLLGLYFSSHPLDSLQEFFESKGVVPVRDALDKKNGDMVVLGVMITKIRRITTKKGSRMAFLTAEDKSGQVDLIVFPKIYEEMKDVLEENKPMLLVGKVNIRDGERSVVLDKAKYIDPSKHSSDFKGVTFRIRPKHSEKEIKELKDFIKSSNGDLPVKLIINDGRNKKTVILEKTIGMSTDTKKFLRKF
jgi:DNA polymerase-3 subunit alpha